MYFQNIIAIIFLIFLCFHYEESLGASLPEILSNIGQNKFKISILEEQKKISLLNKDYVVDIDKKKQNNFDNEKTSFLKAQEKRAALAKNIGFNLDKPQENKKKTINLLSENKETRTKAFKTALEILQIEIDFAKIPNPLIVSLPDGSFFPHNNIELSEELNLLLKEQENLLKSNL